MSSNHNITAGELWHKITTINTTQEWMELTHGFSIFTIYHHCRILQDPDKIETYQCMIRKEYPKSLEKFDEKDPSVVCYMMMGNGNLRRSSNPSFFDRLVDEGVRSAHNDGPYTDVERNKESGADEAETEEMKELPSRLQYVIFEQLLEQSGCSRAVVDRSKLIKLFCLFSGRGLRKTTNQVYNGITFTKTHKPMIDLVNQIFEDLKLPIKIEIGKIY